VGNIKQSVNEQEFVIDAHPAPGSPFHIAIPVHSMDHARDFYGRVLGLKEGRRSDNKWQVSYYIIYMNLQANYHYI